MSYFRRKIFILLLLTPIFLPVIALAGPGRTGAQILNLGGGARARALGDAFSAMSGDVTTSLWNPSGLADMPKSKLRAGKEAGQASMFYTDYSMPFGEAGEGLYYTFISGAIPLGAIGTVGATLQLQGQGTIAVTSDSPEVLREESLGTNFALTFSYADRVTESLSAGISGKMIRMVLGRESGSSYAVDLGLQYRLPFYLLTIGAAIQNVGPGISFIDENQADPLPRFLRIGTSMSLYQDRYHHLRFVSGLTAYIDKLTEDEQQLAVDLERLNAEREEKEKLTSEQLLSEQGVGIRAFEWRHLQKNLGLEYWLGGILALRVGYKSEPGIHLPEWTDYITGGLGVQVYLFNIDFTIGPNLGPSRARLYETTVMFIF